MCKIHASKVQCRYAKRVPHRETEQRLRVSLLWLQGCWIGIGKFKIEERTVKCQKFENLKTGILQSELEKEFWKQKFKNKNFLKQNYENENDVHKLSKIQL